MKQRLFLVLLMFLCAVTMFSCQAADTVTFKDENLEQAIREQIDKKNGNLTKSDFENISALDLANQGIKSLDGIDVIESLEILSVADNEITDFTILKELEN